MPYLELVGVLLDYFLCICKDSGHRYPSSSIKNFHKSFNRILKDAQRVRIAKSMVNEEPFCIEKNPYFVEVTSAVVASMEKSRDAEVNVGRKKPKCLSFAEEALILNHPSHQLTHNAGVEKRMLWYNTMFFMIRGNKEMHLLKYKDFEQGVDDIGRACGDEDFRPPVRLYNADVVLTWKTYDSHLAKNMKDGALFLTPISPHPIAYPIWYKRTNVDEGQLSKWLKQMVEEAGVLGEVTNKSGRRTGITRMALVDTPRDVMC